MAAAEKGWRALSSDVRHAAFWIGGLAACAGLILGGGITYWGYLRQNPPDVLALLGLAAVVLVFVLFYFVTLVSHNYFDKPKHHPFYPRPIHITPPVETTAAPAPLEVPTVTVQPTQIDVRPPDIRTRLFDGAKAGVEVANVGGECRLKAKIQILAVSPKTKFRHRERFPASWRKNGKEVITLKSGQDDHLDFASYELVSGWNYSHYWFKVLRNYSEVEEWQLEDYVPSITLNWVHVMVEIESEPSGFHTKDVYILNLDHKNRVINVEMPIE